MGTLFVFGCMPFLSLLAHKRKVRVGEVEAANEPMGERGSIRSSSKAKMVHVSSSISGSLDDEDSKAKTTGDAPCRSSKSFSGELAVEECQQIEARETGYSPIHSDGTPTVVECVPKDKPEKGAPEHIGKSSPSRPQAVPIPTKPCAFASEIYGFEQVTAVIPEEEVRVIEIPYESDSQERARKLAAGGYDVDILDPRWPAPMDALLGTAGYNFGAPVAGSTGPLSSRLPTNGKPSMAAGKHISRDQNGELSAVTPTAPQSLIAPGQRRP